MSPPPIPTLRDYFQENEMAVERAAKQSDSKTIAEVEVRTLMGGGVWVKVIMAQSGCVCV